MLLGASRDDPEAATGAYGHRPSGAAFDDAGVDFMLPPVAVDGRPGRASDDGAEATLGEICNVLREVWGRYVEPARF